MPPYHDDLVALIKKAQDEQSTHCTERARGQLAAIVLRASWEASASCSESFDHLVPLISCLSTSWNPEDVSAIVLALGKCAENRALRK